MDDIEFDAEAACEFALQWAIATQCGNRESGLILARWRRARRRRLHHGRLPRFVPNLDRVAEACYDADVEDEVEIDEASFFRELEQEERKNMEEADEASFLRELYEQCWEMILHGIVADV